MISYQEMRTAHATAQAVYPRALVLLGGSYCWRGVPNEASDLDLYVVAGWFNFWIYARDAGRAAQIKTKCPATKIMFIPKSLWQKGYYAVSGVDLGGKVHRSSLNWRFIFRNALKLGYLYYLKSRLGNFDYWLRKTDQQIEKLKLASRELKGVSPKVVEHLAVLDELAEEVGEQKRFSWLNYLVYNLFFLRSNRWHFFWSNPDQLVWHELRAVAHLPHIDKQAVDDLDRYAFVVLIR